jgi:hypothetical protein
MGSRPRQGPRAQICSSHGGRVIACEIKGPRASPAWAPAVRCSPY